tara:strand:- start:1339 stop:1638 length:300 start_codon:yes stop_codon:yes gene_type:complete
MGYYTIFELQVISGSDYETDYEEVVSEQADHNPFVGESKWYGFEKDMLEVSKKHPNALFQLSGEGEENGDLWKAYFKEGKMQMCKARIEYDSFNKEKMK